MITVSVRHQLCVFPERPSKVPWKQVKLHIYTTTYCSRYNSYQYWPTASLYIEASNLSHKELEIPYVCGIPFVYPNIHPLRVAHNMIWRELPPADIARLYLGHHLLASRAISMPYGAKLHIVNTPQTNSRSYISWQLTSLPVIYRLSTNVPPTVLHRRPFPPKLPHPLTPNLSIPIQPRSAIQTTRNPAARLGYPSARPRLCQPA